MAAHFLQALWVSSAGSVPDPRWLCTVRTQSLPYKAPRGWGLEEAQSETREVSQRSRGIQGKGKIPACQELARCRSALVPLRWAPDCAQRCGGKAASEDPRHGARERGEAGCRSQATAILFQYSSCTGRLHMALGIHTF